MHARYQFISDKEELDTALNAFNDWIEENGDQNNWFEPCIGINRDGETEVFASSYRRLNDWSKSFLDDHSTFEDVYDFAWECVIYNIVSDRWKHVEQSNKDRNSVITYVSNRLDDVGQEQRTDEFLSIYGEFVESDFRSTVGEEFDDVVSGSVYENVDSLERLIPEDDEEWSEESLLTWELESHVEKLKLLNEAQIVPFALSGTPYNWRAFDVRDDTGVEPKSIVVIDIHT